MQTTLQNAKAVIVSLPSQKQEHFNVSQNLFELSAGCDEPEIQNPVYGAQ